MPSPKECALKYKPGTKEYNDCIAYKGQSAVPKITGGKKKKPKSTY